MGVLFSAVMSKSEMKPTCPECDRLLGRYREARKAWAETNRELTESAQVHEIEMFSRTLGKRHSALNLSKEAAQDFREHRWAVHYDK